MKNIKKTIFVIIYYFLYNTLIYAPFALLNFEFEDIPIIYNIIMQVVFILSLIYIYKNDLKSHLDDFKKNAYDHLKIGFNCWLVGSFAMIVSNIIINAFSPLKLPENEQVVRQLLDTNTIYMIFSAVIVAPIIEETLFRKVIFDLTKNKNWFVIISGVLFGASHIIGSAESFYSWLYIIPYTSLGIAFAYILKKTNNPLPSIIMHSIHNLITILQILLIL